MRMKIFINSNLNTTIFTRFYMYLLWGLFFFLFFAQLLACFSFLVVKLFLLVSIRHLTYSRSHINISRLNFVIAMATDLVSCELHFTSFFFLFNSFSHTLRTHSTEKKYHRIENGIEMAFCKMKTTTSQSIIEEMAHRKRLRSSI